MKVTPELARRERPARAAAPKKSMMEHDSEDEDPLVEPSGSSSVKVTRSDNATSISETSPPSITVISGISDCAMATLNQPSSPKKRSMAETKNDSPTKKLCKIVIKTNKLADYTVTPAPSQAEISPQPASNRVPELQSIIDVAETLQSRMEKDATELSEAKKKIVSLEQMLEAKAGGDDLTNIADADQDLRKENHQLKIRVSELKHLIATLQQQRPAIPDFKVMDEDVETFWQEIGFGIRNFVAQVVTNKPHGVKTPLGANSKDVEFFKKHQKKDITTAPYHFQHYIWKRLVEDVFQAEKATWGGDAGNAFHRYCLDVSEINCKDMEQLSLFKASQADSLARSFNDHNREQARGIAQAMALTLDIFMDPNKDKADAKNSLMNIVKKAMLLNDKFLRSRAFFLTNWIVEFEWEDLDIRHRAGKQGGEMELDIEISPRLRKIGNADGRRFDQAMEICKPMVTVIYR